MTSNKDYSIILFLVSSAVGPALHRPVTRGENFSAFDCAEIMMVKTSLGLNVSFSCSPASSKGFLRLFSHGRAPLGCLLPATFSHMDFFSLSLFLGKQHKFIILSFCRSEVPNGCRWAKISVLAELCACLEAVGETPFPAFPSF